MSIFGSQNSNKNSNNIKNRRVKSISRVYADVNQHRPKEYWDYDSLSITWGFKKKYSYQNNFFITPKIIYQ